MPRGEKTRCSARQERAERPHFRRGRGRGRSPEAWHDPARSVGSLAIGLVAAGLGVLGEWIGATTRGVRRLGGRRHSRVDARRGRKS
jgi:hypothetical protein